MRIILAGGRDFDDTLLLNETLNTILQRHCITEVVCGMAKGADTLGEIWAKENNIKVEYFKADWERFGRGAGHKRNREMGDYADYLVAFWDEKSKGTKGMIEYMRKLKKPMKVVLYNVEDTDDEW